MHTRYVLCYVLCWLGNGWLYHYALCEYFNGCTLYLQYSKHKVVMTPCLSSLVAKVVVIMTISLSPLIIEFSVHYRDISWAKWCRRSLYCLFNNFFKKQQCKYLSPHPHPSLALGIYWWLVDSPYKWPLMWKAFLGHDVFMNCVVLWMRQTFGRHPLWNQSISDDTCKRCFFIWRHLSRAHSSLQIYISTIYVIN